MAGTILDSSNNPVKDSYFKELEIGDEVVFMPYGERSLFKGTIVDQTKASIYIDVFKDGSRFLHVRKDKSKKIYKL